LDHLTEDRDLATTVARKDIYQENAQIVVKVEIRVVRMIVNVITVERVVICREIVLMVVVLAVVVATVEDRSATSAEELIIFSVTVQKVVDTAVAVVLDATTVMKWVISQEIVQLLHRSPTSTNDDPCS
jgi:hypothetical protein